MTRVLVFPSLLLTAVFAALIGGLHVQPRHDIISPQSGECAAPCWQRFQPGVTSYDQTTSLFAALGWVMDSPNCQVYMPTCQSFQWHNPTRSDQKAVANFDQGRIAAILFLTPDVTLGEMLLDFGTPSGTDQYADFDLNGNRFTVYRALWNGLASEVDIDCPTTFALLLREPIHVIANPVQQVNASLRPIQSHSFRHACS